MSNKEPESGDSQDSLTAIDYINQQEELEREARTLMPFDPNECTYDLGELRQQIYACLTCSKMNDNQPIGVCYSCSIQCHSKHDLVELFSKRSFLCDCGTTRMAKTPNGACSLRRADRSNTGPLAGAQSRKSSHIDLPAEDIPSNSNAYNQNFHGKFCACKHLYDPAKETGTMLQCYFGFVCGEDWFHDRCIMGLSRDYHTTEDSNSLPAIDGNQFPIETTSSDEDSDEADDGSAQYRLEHFPHLKTFDEFICWQCVSKFRKNFNQLDQEFPGVIVEKLPRFVGVKSLDEWKELQEKANEPRVKRTKTETTNDQHDSEGYSIFLARNFKKKLQHVSKLDHQSNLYQFLQNNSFLYEDDTIYKPPEDDSDDAWSSTASNTESSALDAIQSLPRDQAIEGIQAYNAIKSKLRDFFKPFAEQGRVVTEDEVKNFFGEMATKEKPSE
ncbi:hypothetical protein KGF57_002363 [Candida theae]|uniref:UBR-type domain-containing protein n=1 Tax=Candida theae TaxID=1198502 RepID=A0AAD5FZ14_9ASCO|nr:uncharacterized protein KGF57_002363 [Candida theae]KAI5958929.1 hypothetical protein KGF57_002363 [Candida theae]